MGKQRFASAAVVACKPGRIDNNGIADMTILLMQVLLVWSMRKTWM
jgi:hypothetical protein